MTSTELRAGSGPADAGRFRWDLASYSRACEGGVFGPDPGIELLDDLELVVEVSESTLRHDLGIKVPLYLDAGVAEVRVIDLTGATGLHLFRPGRSDPGLPVGVDYRHRPTRFTTSGV